MYLAGRALPPAPPVLDAAVSAAALLLHTRSGVHCLLLLPWDVRSSPQNV
jgi:hypothetical protein